PVVRGEALIKNSITLIVGAAGAIGEACARHLVSQGHGVVMADLDYEHTHSIAQKIGAVGSVAIDVVDSASVDKAVRAASKFGPLRAAINVAGVGGPPVRIHEYTNHDWQNVLDVNLTGVFNCLRAEVKAMLGSTGSIVNISSVTGAVGFASAAAYSASKHGVEGLTKSAALEYAKDDIRVNAVAPGFIRTELLTKRRAPEEIAHLANAHPMGRLGQADEVASLASFLLSDGAS